MRIISVNIGFNLCSEAGIHGIMARSIQNTRELIQQDKVFALIGAVGTPTSKPAAFIAELAKVPFLGPYTGARFLRNTRNLKYTINVRASYYQEMEEIISYLVDQKKLQRIACFYQRV